MKVSRFFFYLTCLAYGLFNDTQTLFSNILLIIVALISATLIENRVDKTTWGKKKIW